MVVTIGLGAARAGGLPALESLVATVFRIKTSEGILAVQIDDPEVKLKVDGEELVLTGTGPQEFRYRPGRHQVVAVKDGVARAGKVRRHQAGRKGDRDDQPRGRAWTRLPPEPRPRDSPAPESSLRTGSDSGLARTSAQGSDRSSAGSIVSLRIDSRPRTEATRNDPTGTTAPCRRPSRGPSWEQASIRPPCAGGCAEASRISQGARAPAGRAFAPFP